MVGKDDRSIEGPEYLTTLATESLHLWSSTLPADATIRLINISENATFLVEGKDFRSVLRLHRPNYHTRKAIESEIAWLRAIQADRGVVVTPGVIAGSNGKVVQEWKDRFLVLFTFLSGHHPEDETTTMTINGDVKMINPSLYESLGEIAARTHMHSVSWTEKRPPDFERPVWDTETLLTSSKPTWGHWRDAPGMPQNAAILQRAQDVIVRRLQVFGKSPDRFGLIHADMRLANLLVDNDDTPPRLIDFDDCGMGWFLYDFAAGISFMEDHPQVPELQEAWVRGYRKIRPLSETEVKEMGTFVMLRRLALCAWIGSHGEVDIAQDLAPRFLPMTETLAREYLARFDVDCTQDHRIL